MLNRKTATKEPTEVLVIPGKKKEVLYITKPKRNCKSKTVGDVIEIFVITATEIETPAYS